MMVRRSSFIQILTGLAMSGLFLSAPAFAQQSHDRPLTNAAVVKLVRAGFKEKTVVAIIRSRTNRFELDPDRLIELKRNGVSESIILTMLSQEEPYFPGGDDWSDDSFFKNNGRRSTGGDAADSQLGGTDIFGSTGGSKAQTRGRGMNGSNQGETTTTGSATVRILRPPTEAGAAALKLEKTPTLNNESIVRLVEAGFSEGTIIKRIEDSPVEFDLSPGKLEELRKRLVTDAVINAMTSAMDQAGPKQTAPGGIREK